MHKQLIVGAAAAALLAGPALAENTTPTNTMSKPGTNTSAQTATGTATGSMATTSGTGITRATKASAPVRYGSPDSTDLMSSKLVGVNVYNNQDEKIGEISDIAIEDGKTVNGIVVSVGGFLGVGEKYVLVDPSSIAVHNDNGTWKAHIDTTKENLKSAPEYTYKKS